LPETPQKPIFVPSGSETDTTLTQGSDLAFPASDDLSDRDGAFLMPPPAESGEREMAEDRDASGSEVADADEGMSSKKWAISLIALASKKKTQELQRDYIAKGVDVELVRIGKLFALRIPGFADREEAVAYAEGAKRKLGIRDVWIYEY
jgi:hypothetical protein